MVRLSPGAPRPAALTGLALCLLAVGCSSQGAADRLPDGPEVRPWSGAAHFPAAEATRLHDAVQRAVAACMDERGFAYRPQPAADSRRAAAASPYGLLSRALAKSDGYGVVGGMLAGAGEPPADVNAEAVAGLGEKQGERWREALLGSRDDMREVTVPDGPSVRYDPGSCEVRGREAVYGKGWDEALLAAETAVNRVIEAVEQDAGYRESVREWSACMAGHGYDYADLQAPRAALAARAEQAGQEASALRDVGEEEIEIASRDWRCEREVKLHEAAADAQRRVERAELRRDPELAQRLDRMRAMKRRALSAASASASASAGAGAGASADEAAGTVAGSPSGTG
ncbi:hypothetical protein [Streptomyces sp. PR69]|uniref:hypothetical protein n=1 Tax=Streptomyces sp. PR69 TaxID=2984950 RepID=UPI002263C221|nr:hypothetical protein [Streptomyces sp. PR69]